MPTPLAGTANFNISVGTTIATGADGNIWFLETTASPGPKLARIVTSGAGVGIIREFALPAGASNLLGLAAGADGNLWIKDYAGKIYRVTPDGTATSFTIPTSNTGSDVELVPAPDGTLWFAEDSKLGRISTTGTITEYPLPTPSAGGGPNYPFALGIGEDGIGTFIEYGSGTLALLQVPAGDSPLAAAVLPSSRSLMVGGTSTLSAVMLKSSSQGGTGCHPMLWSDLPVGLSYQTITADNTLSGSPNQPADIPPKAAQNFVISLTGNAAFDSSDAEFGFACADLDAAPVIAGVNTALISASTTPMPDVVALAGTASGNGVLQIATSGFVPVWSRDTQIASRAISDGQIVRTIRLLTASGHDFVPA